VLRADPAISLRTTLLAPSGYITLCQQYLFKSCNTCSVLTSFTGIVRSAEISHASLHVAMSASDITPGQSLGAFAPFRVSATIDYHSSVTAVGGPAPRGERRRERTQRRALIARFDETVSEAGSAARKRRRGKRAKAPR
jgi:hypothetical protein